MSNPSLKSLLGYSADEFLGKDLRNLFSDAGAGMVSQIFSQKNEEDELQQPARIIESSLVRKNGSVFCGEVRIQNLRSMDGTILGTILQIVTFLSATSVKMSSYVGPFMTR